MQNVEHIFSECEYMEEYVDEMIAAVGAAMQSENAEGLTGKVKALVGMETRGVSSEVLAAMGSHLKAMVGKMEARLRVVNAAGMVDRLDMWLPEGESEQQIEAPSEVGIGGVSGDHHATRTG